MVVSIGAYGFDARVVARIDTRAAYICIKLYKIKKISKVLKTYFMLNRY